MKLILTILLLSAFCLNASAEDPVHMPDHILKTIGQIKLIESNKDELAKLQLLKSESKPLSSIQQNRYEELIENQKTSYANILKLKTLINVGDSVFHYPGLLALGSIRYVVGDRYILSIPTGYSLNRPSSLLIYFDSNDGEIQKVRHLKANK
jgi:hypothetical protein